MFLRQQVAFVRQRHHFGEERFDDFMLKQPIPVLGEYRVIPHRLVYGYPHEPAEQQVVLHLFAQHPLRAHRIEHLQQQGAHEFLGGDGVPPGIRVDGVKQAIEPCERFVDQQPDRA